MKLCVSNRPFAKLRWLFIFAFCTAISTLWSDQSNEFIVPATPLPIYHEGWIDLNKNGRKDPYEDTSLDVDVRIRDLVGQMSMEEKTAQMVTLYGYGRVLMDELPTPSWKQAFWKDGIGNIDEDLNGNEGENGQLPIPKNALPYSRHTRALNDVQRFFIEQTRLGIPVDFTNEGIRGLLHSRATSFPAQLAVASSWDVELVHEIGQITGREARVLGYTNVYSPILDLPRDPRWGRVTETYSEDPFLTAELGIAQSSGIQEQRVVSTLKHFAVYSVPKGGRDGEARTDPQVTWRDVQTIFLYPFRRVIKEAGALGVMASYNDYDGIPIEANPLFLTEILRQQWGFRGYVVSDSGAVEFIHDKHRVAATRADAVRQAVEAGLNIRTHLNDPRNFADPLRELVRTSQLSMKTIDSRVTDILRVKYWQGSFDRPYRSDPDEADRVVRTPAHLQAAERAGHEAIVLLKNQDSLLPLHKDLKRILVTGPLANDGHAWYSRYGPQQLDFVTVLRGLREKLGPSVDVRYELGCKVVDANFPESDVLKDPPSADVREGIEKAVQAARDVDVVVAVLGENDRISRESDSRINLNLPGYQEELLEALQATGKPLVLVLSNGRPLTVNWAAKHVSAIVEVWFPGENGGRALADVLFGDYNPSGHLPITIPRSVGQVPYNFPTHPGAQGRDEGQVFGSLYPFGFGLSYTTFKYDALSVTPSQLAAGGEIQVHCSVTNTGNRAGDDVVQLYLRDDYSSVITFERVLRGFKRIHLEAGETKDVAFTLTPAHLELFDRNQHWTVEPGHFTVWIGASSEDLKLEGGFDIIPNASARETAAEKK